MKNYIIHLDKPAETFLTSTAIGNGSMGAMLFGNPHKERIVLSEESIWSGEEHDTTYPQFREDLARVRKMYLSGDKYTLDEEMEAAAEKCVSTIKSCEYAGAVEIDFDDKSEAENYKRDLHLNNAVSTVSYTKNGVNITQEAFCAYADEVIAVKISSSDKISFTLNYSRECFDEYKNENGINTYLSHTQFGDHKVCVGIKAVTDGTKEEKDGVIRIENSLETVIYISITTDFAFGEEYKNTCLDILTEADNYDTILLNHIADFSSLFERSDIDFEADEELEKLPVNERLQRLKDDKTAEDNSLYSLYFAFGKYLCLSSSREGTLPAHLQGVWVNTMENPWNADYHTNINLQMNYWLCEVANLSECHMQLFDYMNNFLLESGKKTAEVNYGCRGTVLHHLSDLYGFTTPADGIWGIWPMGGGWLATHMFQHYLYTLDKDFLKDTAYEYIKQSALFFIDYMFEDNEGRLLSGPSMSPENEYYLETPDGEKKSVTICFSPAMDTEIIGNVLRDYIETENILGIDEKTKAEAQAALAKMPKLSIGKHGQLMEWLEDYDEPEPGHRHISHAFALYPSNEITRSTPELWDAIQKTLERRLSHGGGHTGWSRAWLICLFARLHKGKDAYENVKELFRLSTFDNLFDSHPPRIFQIDGNFGGAAGIAETLLHSHEGFISVLPAAHEGLSGSFKGLKARGNIEVGATFKNGAPLSLTLKSEIAQSVKVELPSENSVLYLDGEAISKEYGLFVIELEADKELTFEIK
ncbi:MAG: glycoside hydrolase family 95 protein [Clostridia bacterium]|nr:glycoside hydrolase family 95 protein [Clostridia bacterium]